MSIAVLQREDEYRDARKTMKKRGIDCVSPLALRILRKLNLTKKVPIGDRKKSWDVLRTVQFIEDHVDVKGPILDIGAYGSEMLCVLHRLHYANLSGIDLNPNMHRMPYSASINYHVGNFMMTPFHNASFDAVTAISVIEHGFDADKLLAEMSRIIKPGGYFIASVDYWPDKIDTSKIKAYGLDWMIFSASELNSFFQKALSYGFAPSGEMNLTAADRTITWLGKQYTFAWLALKNSNMLPLNY